MNKVKTGSMVKKKTWAEFQDTGLLWWINRLLHTFGWAIVFECNDDGKITEVFPARVKFRGFNEYIEEENFIKITKYMANTAKTLEREIK